MRHIERICFGLLVAVATAGSPFSEGVAMGNDDDLDASRFTDDDRAWWCFQPIDDPPVPEVSLPAGGNAVDAFVIARLQASGREEKGLRLASAAEPLALLKRASFDVTGLPASPDEIIAFHAAAERNFIAATAHLVDRLLASPHYGEHGARHWLDLVRYADSDGYKQDDFRPHAYQYRDYVIRSLNEDKPYDRFVIEQLAGDEVDPGNREALVATMFLRHWIYEYNQRDVEFQWQTILNDITETTGDVFLGMGLECARCHDHKFDPILRQDYYRLQAFFAALLPREDQPLASAAQRARYHEELQSWEAATEPIRRRLYEIENPILLEHADGEGFRKFVREIRSLIRKRDVDREPHEQQIAMMASRQFTVDRSQLAEWIDGDLKPEWETLRGQLAEYDALKPSPLPTVEFVVSDVGPVAPVTMIPDEPDGAPVEPGFLTLLNPSAALIESPPVALRSTGRRTALARWIASPDNPLTARVIVNRVWQQHFGRGLVETPSDFGRLGQLPSHPRLLDWLTSRFIEGGWRRKPLHRLIMTSATYRQSLKSAEGEFVGHEADGDLQVTSQLRWQAVSRRLSAEQVRDAALMASGELQLQMEGLGVEWEKPRRAIYTKALRNQIDPLLTAFDAPDTTRGSDRRHVTTTSSQALLMFNGDWLFQRAIAMAARLRAEKYGDEKNVGWEGSVRRGFLLTLGRPPSPEELDDSTAYLTTADESTASVDFCHVLLNSNEMLYTD